MRRPEPNKQKLFVALHLTFLAVLRDSQRVAEFPRDVPVTCTAMYLPDCAAVNLIRDAVAPAIARHVLGIVRAAIETFVEQAYH